jgi:xanthine/uracil/vitamin C permease (AzgA family)
MCGIGCIIGGLFANLPFIIAPPTAISIFLSIFLQQNRLDTAVGNQAVVASGIGLIFLGYRPLGRFLSQVSSSSTAHPPF